MKKIYFMISGLVLVSVFAGHVYAFKPDENPVQKVDWNLSASVMPVPPYGSQDIAGSDKASKLSVKQSFCKTDVKIKGVMRKLLPQTTYTVYLANGYTPYKDTGWNVQNTYGINVKYLGVDYPETMILSQTGTTITGVSLDTVPPASYFTVNNGTVIGNVINIYANQGSLVVHMWGTIATDGSMSGDWADVDPGTRTGTWTTTNGVAVKTHTGDTGYPGLFTSSVQPFTFKTNKKGVVNWHLNLGNKNFPGPGTYTLSVWLNGSGATLLISDNFKVTAPDKQCRDERNRWYDDHDEFDRDED